MFEYWLSVVHPLLVNPSSDKSCSFRIKSVVAAALLAGSAVYCIAHPANNRIPRIMANLIISPLPASKRNEYINVSKGLTNPENNATEEIFLNLQQFLCCMRAIFALLMILALLAACEQYQVVEDVKEAPVKEAPAEITDNGAPAEEPVIEETAEQEEPAKVKASLKPVLDQIKDMDLEDIDFKDNPVVVGDNAPAEDVISASNIALVTGSRTILSSEARNEDLIFVGSPCVNEKMAVLLDFFNEDLCDGYEYPMAFNGVIFQVNNNIFVWGKTSADTRKLSENIQDIDGNLVVI